MSSENENNITRIPCVKLFQINDGENIYYSVARTYGCAVEQWEELQRLEGVGRYLDECPCEKVELVCTERRILGVDGIGPIANPSMRGDFCDDDVSEDDE
jgi:hypothetical protein